VHKLIVANVHADMGHLSLNTKKQDVADPHMIFCYRLDAGPE
jgi:hypothetical protein